MLCVPWQLALGNACADRAFHGGNASPDLELKWLSCGTRRSKPPVI